MAKGIVKGINTGMQGSTTSVGITTTPSIGGGGSSSINQPSSNPPGQVMMGTIQDLTNPQLVPINFSQAFGAEMGLAENVKVNYVTITVGGQTIANTVKLLQRGEILSINADDVTGTLLDRSNGNTIPFAQTYANEMGLVARAGSNKGTMVHFETIVDPNTGQLTAVALEIIGG